jgi:hypothetical protein
MSALEQQPPPLPGAKPGFYPDPLRTGRARWWDGSSWTLRMGPRVSADAPAEKQVPPPTKVCRHCGAQPETHESKCPNCGKGYEQNTGVIIAIVAAAVAVVLLLGGCAVFIAAVVDDVDDIDPPNAITQAEFDSVPLGATRGSVEARLGEAFEIERFQLNRGPVLCLYYNQAGQGLFDDDEFRLCFAAGRLYAKREGS